VFLSSSKCNICHKVLRLQFISKSNQNVKGHGGATTSPKEKSNFQAKKDQKELLIFSFQIYKTSLHQENSVSLSNKWFLAIKIQVSSSVVLFTGNVALLPECDVLSQGCQNFIFRGFYHQFWVPSYQLQVSGTLFLLLYLVLLQFMLGKIIFPSLRVWLVS